MIKYLVGELYMDSELKSPVKEILLKLMNANSLEEIEEIIEEVTSLYENRTILTEDALLLTNSLIELKNKLGFLQRKKTPKSYKASLKEIRDLLDSMTLEVETGLLSSQFRMYGLFGINNVFTLASYENCSAAYIRGGDPSDHIFTRRAVINSCTAKLLDGTYPINKNYLENNVHKIIDIMGVETYVTSDLELFGGRVYYKDEAVATINEEINKFLKENVYFTQDLFNQVKRGLTL